MKLTCIGGPYDGLKHDGSGVEIHLPRIVSVNLAGDGWDHAWPSTTRAVEYEIYALEDLAYGRQDGRVVTRQFWVHWSLTRDDAAERLLDHYQGTESPPPSLSLRALVLAADMEAKAARLYAEFADKTDILSLRGGASCEDGAALYIAADLVRQAWAKMKDLEI